MIPWMLILAHARRNKLRTLLTAGSVAIALFLYCGLRTVITSIDATVSQAESGRLITQSSVSLFASLPISMFDKLKTQPGVRAVTHWTWFGGVYIEPSNFFARFAVDAPTLREVYGDRWKGGKPDLVMPTEAWEAFAGDRRGCIVGRALVEKFRDEKTGESAFDIGREIPLIGNIYPGDYRFTVRGHYTSGSSSMDEATMFFHWDYVNETVGQRGTVSTYTLDLEDPSLGPEVASAVDERFRSSANRSRTLTERAFQAQFVSMWGNVPLFLSFIGGAVLFAAFMVTLNTLLLNAIERITEVGVLKTLGFPDGVVGMLNLVEALVLCLLGAALGIGFAFWVFNFSPLHKLMQNFLPTFEVLNSTVVEGLVIGAVLGLVSGALPGIMAARIPVVKALRRLG